MLFVLAGPSYVGKKTAISHFVKLYSFSSVIPYTTKEKRSNETEGIQYHYIDEDYIKDNATEFFYDKPFDTKEYRDNVIYAYKKADITKAVESYSNFIIHASSNNAKQIFKAYDKDSSIIGHLFIIFLDYSNELTQDFFRTKCPYPSEKKNASLFQRRYRHAEKERFIYKNNKGIFSERMTSDNPYELCDKLERYILPKLNVMPTAPDKIPGPLSDEDIIYMAFKRRNNPLCVRGEKGILKEPELREILSGCGMHITLSSKIRKVKQKTVNNFINMKMDEANMEVCLNSLFPQDSIATGYLLKPNETILCSSNEHITFPQDVYAIVASRFSYAQLGLSIELGTSIIQAGHDGVIHFQIHNHTGNYIYIYPNISVAQLIFYRTIQPGSDIYRQLQNSHNYDLDSQPPLPKFKESDSGLNSIPIPKKSIFNVILDKFKDKMSDIIVGLLSIIFFIAVGMTVFPDQIRSFMSLIVKVTTTMFGSVETIWQCVGIAVYIEIIRAFLVIVGRVIAFVVRKCKYFLLRKTGNNF